jgi:hypothetical protein
VCDGGIKIAANEDYQLLQVLDGIHHFFKKLRLFSYTEWKGLLLYIVFLKAPSPQPSPIKGEGADK